MFCLLSFDEEKCSKNSRHVISSVVDVIKLFWRKYRFHQN